MKVLRQAPYILAVLFALFISIFAFDVFGEGYSVSEATIGFLIHLVPTYFVVIALLIARKNKTIGGSLFILLGIFYTIFTRGRFDLLTYLLIPGTCFLIGVLFLLP